MDTDTSNLSQNISNPTKKSAAVISDNIKKLRRRMRMTNIFFHIVRNNPRHRDRYYFELIAIIGYENWSKVNDTIRMNWESARLSFDKMYGMVKNFAKLSDTYSNMFLIEAPENTESDELHQNITKSLDKFNENMKKFIEISGKLHAQLEDKERFNNMKSSLTDCRDLLNKLIPPEPTDKPEKK